MPCVNDSILIVCYDDRAFELAAILSKEFQVYLRRERGYSVLVDGEWSSVRDNAPSSYSALFFHTGQGDPDLVPTVASFGKAFAFSSDGVTSERAGSLCCNAVAIERRFAVGSCPVKPRHLPALKDFIGGQRSDPPEFCRRDDTVPTLWALAIACQAYAAVGIAAGELTEDDHLAKALNWDGAECRRVRSGAGGIGRRWQEMQKPSWWAFALGFGKDGSPPRDDVRYRTFLARLATDMELDRTLREALAPPQDAELAEFEARKLEEMLEQQPSVCSIKELLSGVTITKEVVAKAVLQIKKYLRAS